MQNYFSLLGLNQDPFEDNENIIKEAINDKIKEWQMLTRNPVKANYAKKMLVFVPEIKDIMLNKEKREDYIKVAEEDKKNREEFLLKEINIYGAKGFLNNVDIENLYMKYKEYGFSVEKIKSLSKFKIIESKDPVLNLKYLNKEISDKLISLFKQLGIKDLSLYEYLDVLPSDTLTFINKTIDEKIRFIITKGEKENDDAIHQKILDIAKSIFKDPETQTLYDNFLLGNRFLEINELVKNSVSSNNNVLNTVMFEALLEVSRAYGLTDSTFKEYLKYNSSYHNYIISLDFKSELNDTKESIYVKNKKEQKTKKEISFEDFIKPIMEILNKNISETIRIANEVEDIQQERNQKKFHPPLYGSILIMLISIILSFGVVASYLINKELIEIPFYIIAIVVLFNLFFFIKTVYRLVSWFNIKDFYSNIIISSNIVIEKKNKIDNLSTSFGFNKNIISLPKIKADLNKINSEICDEIDNININLEKWNNKLKKLKIPRTGFNPIQDIIYILPINIIIIILIFGNKILNF